MHPDAPEQPASEASPQPASETSPQPATAPILPRKKPTVRQVIFASIWLIVGVAVAVALVKLAFFNSRQADAAAPSGSLASPTVTVTRDTVINEFTASGSLTADPGVPQRATDQGTVTVVFVKQGDRVERGQPLFEVREEIGQTEPEPIGEPDPTSTEPPEMSTPEPIYQYHEIVATASGVLTKFTPLPKMQVGVGDEIGEVGPGTFTAVANISADLQFRMLDQPSQATVSIAGGPAPFDCGKIEIGAVEGDQAPDAAQPDPMYADDPYAPPAEGGNSPVTGQLRCAVPEDQKVFAGLSAEITVVSGSAEDVLVLPVTAVRGDYATGIVYLPSDSGDPVEQPVELGLTDGVMIEIKSGLNEGDTVLEYVPSEVPMYQEDPGW